MSEYRDPQNHFAFEYPEGWLPLTHEGSPHLSLASLTTGGFLKIEGYQFLHAAPNDLRPEGILRTLLNCEQRRWPQMGLPAIHTGMHQGALAAWASFTRRETGDLPRGTDLGHTRAWVFSRGSVQVRCFYRCRSEDCQTDDEDLDRILDSLVIEAVDHLDVAGFASYYFSLLKKRRPQLPVAPMEGLTLMLPDSQPILLDHLYNHYLLEPQRLDELIEGHIERLDYCGDDVPNLDNYEAVKSLLFPKILSVPSSRELPPHRMPLWPGLAVGAVVQGRVFSYGVNLARLNTWGRQSLQELREDLLDNLYALPPVAPRGLRDPEGTPQALSYVDHPFAASFVLFDDFYETTAHNLGVSEFLVGLPDPGCVSCFREDDPRFVVQHTALLRWDYHRSVDRLTDSIYLVSGPDPQQVKRYDILHCCPKAA